MFQLKAMQILQLLQWKQDEILNHRLESIGKDLSHSRQTPELNSTVLSPGFYLVSC